jgi:hypothetical protein
MKRSSSSRPPSGVRPVELRTLGAIAAALTSCTHPEACRVSANVIVTDRAVRISWCATCGAMSSSKGGGGETWQTSALVSLLGKSHLEELAALLRNVRKCAELAESSPPGESQSTSPALHELRSILSELARTAIVRDLGHLQDAIAHMPDRPGLVAP